MTIKNPMIMPTGKTSTVERNNGTILVSGIVKESIVDGPGLRLVVFAQGCPHGCPGCHNPHTHTFKGGTHADIDSIMESVRANPLLNGVTFSGGEPFEQAERFAVLAERVKALGLHVMTYTGYTFETILERQGEKKGWRDLLNRTDVLVDGPFILERRSLGLRFRGSDNQRLIDVPRSLQQHQAALYLS